ncbi:histidine kinase [Amphibacillus sp. MSJ-3]|uniref:sensor histidine kinase n=1 Tax=Amphibacillus sp. MSJ-3 TaxID=2841505 RepID=UPI001C0EFB53|nr:histidine kinase [Amphibacillus sp. MSJ-3]MBU5594325.1 histidine kinase [Amphibacillus sp. MSJ-3]
MKKKTIKEVFLQSNRWMGLVATIPLIISVIIYTHHLFVYQRAVTNIHQANKVSSRFRTDVLEDIWDLVYGQTTPERFNHNNTVNDLRQEIEIIKHNTETQTGTSTLNLTLEAIDALEDHIEKIEYNILNNESLEKNEGIMKQVESSNLLVLDILQEFVEIEINYASNKGSKVMHSVVILSFIQVGILVFNFIFLKKVNHYLAKNVEEPIHELIKMADEISQGNLKYRTDLPNINEISILSAQMNRMADRLNILLAENAKKQYHLAQSEMRVLQAQITPHFVYNSMDAILTLAEQGDIDSVKKMTYALSDFFRISLSKGQDWITVEKEIKHISDYLLILKIRYGEMLTYNIDIPQEMFNFKILKMVLQPIVENAVYHGIKLVRRIGYIHIRGWHDNQHLYFSIEDNGKGVPEEKLTEIHAELAKGIETNFKEGYGLYNVNKRLLLYYGESAKITFDSTLNKGTTVKIKLPLQTFD